METKKEPKRVGSSSGHTLLRLATLAAAATILAPAQAQQVGNKDDMIRPVPAITITKQTPYVNIKGYKIYLLEDSNKNIDLQKVVSPCTNHDPAAVYTKGNYHCPPVKNAGSTSYGNTTSTTTQDTWAGYVSSTISPTFNAVQASFAVDAAPPVRGTSAATSSKWAGIGGYGDPTLIQAGYGVYYDSKGAAQYYPWYELFPISAVAINNFSILPLDTINVAITPVPNQQNMWNISMLDVTSGQGFTVNVNYQSGQMSAEIIIERVYDCTRGTCVLTPLINSGVQAFGNDYTSSFSFSANMVNSGTGLVPLSQLPNISAINMVESLTDPASPVIATTSPLSQDGTSFSIDTGQQQTDPARKSELRTLRK